jgi:hypothetical protein
MKKAISQVQNLWFLVDVMRLGVGANEKAKPDVELWVEHQREIEFTLRVLSGLNLGVWHEPNEERMQDISPSNALKRLHRNSRCHYTYRHSRDQHLQAALAVATADKTGTSSK